MGQNKDQTSPEVLLLVAMLKNAKPGSLITFEEFSEAVGGIDIQGRRRYFLSAAIAKAEKEYGVIVISNPSIGYTICEQLDVARVAETKGMSTIKNGMRRWRDRLEGVDYGELDDNGKRSYIKSSVKLTLVESATSPERIKAAETKTFNIVKNMGALYRKQTAIEAVKSGVS